MQFGCGAVKNTPAHRLHRAHRPEAIVPLCSPIRGVSLGCIHRDVATGGSLLRGVGAAVSITGASCRRRRGVRRFLVLALISTAATSTQWQRLLWFGHSLNVFAVVVLHNIDVARRLWRLCRRLRARQELGL